MRLKPMPQAINRIPVRRRLANERELIRLKSRPEFSKTSHKVAQESLLTRLVEFMGRETDSLSARLPSKLGKSPAVSLDQAAPHKCPTEFAQGVEVEYQIIAEIQADSVAAKSSE